VKNELIPIDQVIKRTKSKSHTDPENGSELVEVLRQGKTFEEIIDKLQIHEDGETFVAGLMKRGLVRIIQDPRMRSQVIGSRVKSLQIQMPIQIVGDKAIEEAFRELKNQIADETRPEPCLEEPTVEATEPDLLNPVDVMSTLLERIPEPKLDNIIALAIAAAAREADTWKKAGQMLGLSFRQVRHLKEKANLRGLIEDFTGEPCVRPISFRHPPGVRGELSIKKANRETEARLIREALEKTHGNRTHAARLLDMSHRALIYKLKEYDIGDRILPNRKLNEEAAKVIKWLIRNRPDISYKRMADAYGVSRGAVGHIATGLTWAQVEV